MPKIPPPPPPPSAPNPMQWRKQAQANISAEFTPRERGDADGNMTKRNATNSTCTSGGDAMTYDVENRMTSMTTASGTTSFAYNGDGARVSRTVSTGTTYYIGNYYEVWKPAGSATYNKYYYFGSNRVATRINGTLFYMQGDHLGSSTLLIKSNGDLQTRQAYFPYGDKRLADGIALPTGMDTTFTGQKSDDSTGLMYYGSRYYDTLLGRFTQADTIVPNQMNPQHLNRYSYVSNNPVRYTDPTGHMEEDEATGGDGTTDPTDGPGPYVVTVESVAAADAMDAAADTGADQDPAQEKADHDAEEKPMSDAAIAEKKQEYAEWEEYLTNSKEDAAAFFNALNVFSSVPGAGNLSSDKMLTNMIRNLKHCQASAFCLELAPDLTPSPWKRDSTAWEPALPTAKGAPSREERFKDLWKAGVPGDDAYRSAYAMEIMDATKVMGAIDTILASEHAAEQSAATP